MVQATSYTLITSYSVETIFLVVFYTHSVSTRSGDKMQITLHTTFLFIVFTVYFANFRPYLHHVSPYILASTIIFNINFITGGFVSIWGLYVLYDCETTVCIPAFLIWIAQICTSAIAIRITATTPNISITFSPVDMLLWAIITTLNLCVAIQICFRLCIAQKRTHTLSPSPCESVAIILVESGALMTVGSVAMMILYACNFSYALVSLGIATEVAVASQLLITARHGMLSRVNDPLSPNPTAIEVNVVRSEFRHVDLPTVHARPKTLRSFSPESKSQDKRSWQLLDDIRR